MTVIVQILWVGLLIITLMAVAFFLGYQYAKIAAKRIPPQKERQ